jgi:DNA-binding NarL/FixJ family response regulator
MIRSITSPDSVPAFTQKEVDFLKLCCTELTYKEIAEQLFVSPRTVDNYRETLFTKLSLKSRVGLVLYAIQHEVVKL